MSVALAKVIRPAKSTNSGILFWWIWQVIVPAVLVAVLIAFRAEPFDLSLDVIPILFPAIAYLLLSLLIVPAAARSPGLFLALALVAALPAIAALYVIDRFGGTPVPPMVMAASGVAALAAALVPYLAGKLRYAVIALLALLAVAALASQWHKINDARSGRVVIPTAFYALDIEARSDLIPRPAVDGGAIQGIGSGAVVATGEGNFFWIAAKDSKGRLTASRLDIPAPTDRKAYLADFKDPQTAPRLRITDMLFETAARPAHVYVAHQHWEHAQRCYDFDVSVIALRWGADGRPAAASGWKTLYRSKPCLKAEKMFDDSESAGQLAWNKDGKLLLTTGSWGSGGLDGKLAFSQDANSEYGKILTIDPVTGAHMMLTMGHRNPEGLAVAPDGRIWEAEHGPQGGDEINLIVPGANYGWPNATYGAEYGTASWPLDPEGRTHGSYQEPAIAFVPSVATSALIVVGGKEFPRWTGDLLVASLRSESLYRARTSGDRIIYVESIPIGQRLRDLTQTADGKILLWADNGTVIKLKATSRSAFGRYCAGCHQPSIGAPAGPSLKGLAGRAIASLPDYSYSAALKGRKGVWDRATLDAFLRDPAAFAPGTAMMLQGVDDKSRAEIVNQLMENPK